MKIFVKQPKISGLELLDLLIEFSYLAVIFLIPLWFAYWLPTYNAFELNKTILFRVLVEFLLLFTVLKIIFYWPFFPFTELSRRQIRLFIKKYWLIPFILVAGLALSLFFSVNRWQSFYGSYDWQAGWLSYAFNALWFILLSFNLPSINNRLAAKASSDTLTKKLKRIIKVAVVSGFFTALYGILQILNIDFITWFNAAWEAGRAYSTFGQPNFLAAFLLFVIPLNVYLFLKNRHFWTRLFWGLSLVFILIALSATASRGALVALGLASLLLSGYLIFWFRQKLSKAGWLIAGLLAGLLAVSLAMNFFMPGRLSSAVDSRSGSLAARANFYSAASEAIAARPLTGYGLETGGEIFIRYYQPDWGIPGDVSASTNQAHNLILDILLATGAIGLILFILWYYLFFHLAASNLKSAKPDYLSLALLIGGTAYLISLFFSFTFTAGEVYFWLFLAILAVINYYQDKEIKDQAPSHPLFRKRYWPLKVLAAAGLIYLIGSWAAYDLRAISADHYFNKLYYALAQKDYFTVLVLDNYIQQTKTSPINLEAYNLFLGEKLSEFYPSIDELASKKVVRLKLEELIQKLPRSGYRNILTLAQINGALGNSASARRDFALVAEITPHWPEVYFKQGQFFQQTKNYPEAILSYRLALANLPDFNDPRLAGRHKEVASYYRYVIDSSLGNIYFALGDYPAAEKYYHFAYRDNPTDFTILKKIADTYYRRGNLVLASQYNQKGWSRNQLDLHWPQALAILAWEQGDKVQARSYLQAALKLAPQNELLQKLLINYGQ